MYLWLIQKNTKFCKAIILQFKKKKREKPLVCEMHQCSPRRRTEKGSKKTFEQLIAENFPNMERKQSLKSYIGLTQTGKHQDTK